MEEKLSFEEGMQRLEGLVQALESGQMPLEESFKTYEAAIRLRKALEALLDEGDRRIRILTESGEAEITREDVQ